jgi:hypothetical protein
MPEKNPSIPEFKVGTACPFRRWDIDGWAAERTRESMPREPSLLGD